MANSNNQLLKEIRFDWNKEEILEILNMPLIDLMWESQIVHRKLTNTNSISIIVQRKNWWM